MIEVLDADITKLEVDAISNAANTRLIHGGGVAGAISRAGGFPGDEAARIDVDEVRTASRVYFAPHVAVGRATCALCTSSVYFAPHVAVVRATGALCTSSVYFAPHVAVAGASGAIHTLTAACSSWEVPREDQRHRLLL